MASYGKEKHPLEYFEGMSREEILAVNGVGSKKYTEIRRALFRRSVKRFFTSPFLAVAAGWKAFKREWDRTRPRRVPRKGKTRGKGKPRAKQFGPKVIFWILIALLALALIWFGLRIFVQLINQTGNASTQLVAPPTPTLRQGSSEVAAAGGMIEEIPIGTEGFVYLRVETQRLDTAYGIWRREPGVTVLLSPFVDGDTAPDIQRQGTVRQVTEEISTVDNVKVAATTFEAYSGAYWVWVDESSLLAGCSVWVPRFDGDADSNIVVDEPVVVRLGEYAGFNTVVLKFQIVCGQVSVEPSSTVVNTSPPRETPTNPPETPEPTKTPEPSDTPPPTEVTCSNCEEDPPQTPVPTPEPIEVTATPSR